MWSIATIKIDKNSNQKNIISKRIKPDKDKLTTVINRPAAVNEQVQATQK